MAKLLRMATVALLVALAAVPPPSATASPRDLYEGPHFGEGNLPEGCVADRSRTNPDNVCHHIKLFVNPPDSPQIDVLVLVPASPTAERDMRITRQAIEMWEGGIDCLGREMGLDWLADGVDFHITVDRVDLDGGGGELTTYPVVDPEIVVIVTNPVGGAGIGTDPVEALPIPFAVIDDPDDAPCHPVQNPFAFEQWEMVPGFDRHHDDRSGTYYAEDCDGAGGNVCFAVNGAIDPAPDRLDVFGVFDLVAHEVGHCLSLGHVGDGLEGLWGVVPTDDIMAYSGGAVGVTKCVSTLDVEAFALRMSRYLDVDGDGDIDGSDVLEPNGTLVRGDQFQTQHPSHHLYASGTGRAIDCPQPDVGLLPGPVTDWTPDPAPSVEPAPTASAAAHDDADDDATSPLTEIRDVSVEVTATHVEATLRLGEVWPDPDVTSAVRYGLTIDSRRFYSFAASELGSGPHTWDFTAFQPLPPGSSVWDPAARTVTFRIPRDHLISVGIDAPYEVTTFTTYGGGRTPPTFDDSAPDRSRPIAVAAP